MRPLKPTPFSTAAYPLLQLGWRLLAAAPLALPALAHADATVPKPPEKKTEKRAEAPKPPIKHTGGVMVMPDPPLPPPKAEKKEPPVPAPKKKKPDEYPEFDGGMGRVLRPRATTILFAALEDERAREPRALVIHPHAPDEPCRRRSG